MFLGGESGLSRCHSSCGSREQDTGGRWSTGGTEDEHGMYTRTTIKRKKEETRKRGVRLCRQHGDAIGEISVMKGNCLWRIIGHRWQLVQMEKARSGDKSILEVDNVGSREVHSSSPSTSLCGRKHGPAVRISGRLCGLVDWLRNTKVPFSSTPPTLLTSTHCPPSTPLSCHTVLVRSKHRRQHGRQCSPYGSGKIYYKLQLSCSSDQKECSTTRGNRHDDLSVPAPKSRLRPDSTLSCVCP